MAKLWKPKEDYIRLETGKEEWFGITSILPYERLYESLTQEELRKLIQDARRNRWQALDLHRCGLTKLPEELGNLQDLRVLDAGNGHWGDNDNFKRTAENEYKRLPESIGRLSNLLRIYLDEMPLTALPVSFGHLSNLQTLGLQRTRLTALPESIGQLFNLQTLYLNDTQLTALPVSFGHLSNLQTLYLYNTPLTALPESIGQLSNLQTLDLSYCHLKSIPYGVVQLGLRFVTNNLTAQDCINLCDVTLDEQDISLFEQPHEVIEEYYRNRIAESERVNECKVIFLGDGAAGKSSLIERIIHNDFNPGSLPTDGVKMTKWSEYPNGAPLTLDGKPLTLRFLDFGGQEIMHSMHRCFLTNHTVYVVVCESRDDAEIDNVAARWMETVKSFAPECPVILVLNKCDLNPHVTINERKLKAVNPQYRHTLHTSAKTGLEIERLTDDILQEVPACIRKMRGNRGFLGLKNDLENMEADYLLPEDFQERCDHFQIKENLRLNVLNWFQDLGVAYPYTLTVQEVYVLNPAWLTNGIYRLILRTKNGGFLRHSEIRETLGRSYSGDMSEKTYTAQEMEFILYIMRKFEISLRVTDDYAADGLEMIPMKMEKTPPDRYDEFPKNGALHLRWEAGYLPNNLVHRLMIRKYPELDPAKKPEEKCVWRTGGWFRSTDGGCEALVEMTDKGLDVYARGGRDAKGYMDGFRRQILSILRDLNITAEEWIYCTVNGKTGRIPYEYVMNRRRRGIEEIYLGDIDEDVSIEKLLSENYVDAPRDFFISYTQSDKARAAWITDTLRENGYTVYFQGTDCQPGTSFPQWMAEAISDSRGFLAVWSRAYEESGYCKAELNAAFVRAHNDKRYVLLPVRVEEVPIGNPLFQPVVHVDLFSGDEAADRENLLNAARQVKSKR